jgi:putative CocE/NonD family hydrolase
VTANVFQKGHRLRLDISSSNFPRFDRNPNTGGQIADETRLLKANQVIYHGRERPSHVELPVIPEEPGGEAGLTKHPQTGYVASRIHTSAR